MFVRQLSCTDIRCAKVRDLGEGGACLVADEPLPVGSEIYVGVFLRDDPHPVVAMALVVWTRPEADGHAMGLAFARGGAGQRLAMTRLADYLAARRPAPSAP